MIFSAKRVEFLTYYDLPVCGLTIFTRKLLHEYNNEDEGNGLNILNDEKIVVARPLASHLAKHPNKTNKTCWELLGK